MVNLMILKISIKEARKYPPSPRPPAPRLKNPSTSFHGNFHEPPLATSLCVSRRKGKRGYNGIKENESQTHTLARTVDALLTEPVSNRPSGFLLV